MLTLRHYGILRGWGRGTNREDAKDAKEEGKRISMTQSFCDYTVSVVFKGALWMLRHC